MTKNIILLQALASMPLEIMRLLKDLDEATAYQPTAPDESAIAQVLSHMIEVETHYRGNFQRMVQEDGLTWSLHESDSARDEAVLSLDALISRLEAARAKTLTFLSTLSPSDWGRAIPHETYNRQASPDGGQASPDGETPFQFWVQHLIEQDRVHLNQLATLRGR